MMRLVLVEIDAPTPLDAERLVGTALAGLGFPTYPAYHVHQTAVVVGRE